MRKRTHQQMKSPIIGRASLLNQNVNKFVKQTPKSLHHPYVDILKSQAFQLFVQAFRQVKGRDYYKRAMDTIEEVQAITYLLVALGGLTTKQAIVIDSDCDDIIEQLNKMRNSTLSSQNAETKG